MDNQVQANYNGGWSQQLYNLNEAMNFAQDSSRIYAGDLTTMSLTRVYADGNKVGQFLDGQPV